MMSSFFRRSKYGKEVDNKPFLRNGKILLEKLIASCDGKYNPIRDFSAVELQTATNNYDTGKMIVEAAFFKLYKGFLGDRPITVMKFKETRNDSFEFCVNNIVFASQMSHKNVLKLIGCCLHTKIPILVFESVQCGTLHDHIIIGSHYQRHFKPLIWRDRLKIAMEIANALAYLHVGFPRPIVHRDLKPSNFLLDEQYVAKLFDFSFSEIIPEGETYKKGDIVKGTSGFLAPEYITRGDFNEKCDVYCFGGLLLVLLTGQRIMQFPHCEDQGPIFLVDLVKKYFHENKLNERIDPIILGDETSPEKERQLNDFTELVVKCLSESAEHRPSMVDVAQQLRQLYKSSINMP